MAHTRAWAALKWVLRAMADLGCWVSALCNQDIGIKAHHECTSLLLGLWDLNLSRERYLHHPRVRVLAGAFAPSGHGCAWGALWVRRVPAGITPIPRLSPAVQPLCHLPAHQMVQQLP